MDDQPYGTKSDIWSVGCILHELATFSPPFHGKALGAVVYQILHAEPPALPSCYSRELQDLVKTLLTKDPQVRPCESEWANVLAWTLDSQSSHIVYARQARPEIRDVLRSEFALRHVFQVASAAPSQHSQPLESLSWSGQVGSQQQSPALLPQAPNQLQCQANPVLVGLLELRPPAKNRIHSQQQPNQQQQRQSPPPAQPDQQELPQSHGFARQIFFENQVRSRCEPRY